MNTVPCPYCGSPCDVTFDHTSPREREMYGEHCWDCHMPFSIDEKGPLGQDGERPAVVVPDPRPRGRALLTWLMQGDDHVRAFAATLPSTTGEGPGLYAHTGDDGIVRIYSKTIEYDGPFSVLVAEAPVA